MLTQTLVQEKVVRRLARIHLRGALDFELYQILERMSNEHETRHDALAIFDRPVDAVLPEFGRVSSRYAVLWPSPHVFPNTGQPLMLDLDGSLVKFEDATGRQEFVLLGMPSPRI